MATTAQSLPFEDGRVDEILCGFLLWVWIEDEQVLVDIFREFLRVLKPGGAVKPFPLPQWRRLESRYPDLRNTLSAFTISQHFVPGNQRARTMSAMLTTLVKL